MIATLPPDVRARLRPLRLYARRARATGGLGQHQSRSRGAGLEFAQYRGYEPGDEPRRIDWKLYARSDRYFVRESERDSALSVWLMVDATASMAQADQARPGYTKLDAARAVAACVMEMALRQGDRFGVLAFSGGALHGVPLGAGPRHRDRALLALSQVAASGDWPDEAALRPLWETIAPESLLLFLDDGFEERCTELAVRMAATRREVLHAQILGADEREFPFRGGHRFVDPESGAAIATDAPSARAEFLRRFGAARVALARRLAGAGIRHCEHFLDEAPDAPLQRLFPPRGAAAAGA
jgi:uncharacterized protein (DUF58 family)